MDALVAAQAGAQHKHYQKASLAAKAAGSWQSLWKAGGQPGAGANPGSTAGAIPTSATAGAFSFTDPTTGITGYLGKLSAAGATSGTLILYDRLWANSTLSGTVTTAQTFTQPALTRPDALGADVELWLEIYTATGATAVTATASYTDQDGNTGQSATCSLIASPVAGQMLPFSLAAGDTGVRSVQSVTLSATTATAGDFGLTLLRRVAEIPLAVPGVGLTLDNFGLGLPIVYNSACLALMVFTSTTSTGALLGGLDIIQG